MTVALEERKKQYRIIFEVLWSGNPRIYAKDVASILHVDPRAASRRMTEAYDLGYVSKLQVRMRSYENTKEYVYFVKSAAYPPSCGELSDNSSSYQKTYKGLARKRVR